MKASHARPMLAFWLIAAVAAVVTSVGLHEGGSRVTVRAGSPTPVTGTDSSGLMLGEDLRPVPTPGGTPSVAPQPGSWPSATAIAYAARRSGSAVSAPEATPLHAKPTGSPTTRARASSTAPARSTKQRRHTTHRPTTHRPTTHRPASHRPTSHRPTPHRPTPHRPTAAATPPGPSQHHPQANGHGQGADHGKGAGAPGHGHGPTSPGSSGH